MEKGFFRFFMNLLKVVVTFLIVLIFSVIFVQRVSNNSVNFFGYSLYTVVTESMVPEYNVSDMIIAKEVDPSTINIGDDVVYIGKVDDFKNKIVTHRVVNVIDKGDEYDFVTKGINNMIEDPEINENQILGKVLFKCSILSFLSRIVNNIYGFYFIVFVPLVVIIFLEVMETINDKKELKKERKL